MSKEAFINGFCKHAHSLGYPIDHDILKHAEIEWDKIMAEPSNIGAAIGGGIGVAHGLTSDKKQGRRALTRGLLGAGAGYLGGNMMENFNLAGQSDKVTELTNRISEGSQEIDLGHVPLVNKIQEAIRNINNPDKQDWYKDKMDGLRGATSSMTDFVNRTPSNPKQNIKGFGEAIFGN